MPPEPAVAWQAGGRKGGTEGIAKGRSAEAWRWVGWFGMALAVAGVGDFILTWVPLDLGTPEWEFGTIAASFSGLPLVTMGFAGLLGSAVARGIRWQTMAIGAVLVLIALTLIGALILFWLVVPVALGAVEGTARVGIVKAIVRTTVLGVLFPLLYAAAGIGAIRFAQKD